MLARIFLTIGIFLALGCDRDDQVVTYTAPRDSRPAPATLPAPNPASAGQLKFDLPGGWQEIENPSPMRVATIKAGEAELIVTRLAKGGWGDLLGNVNRWRGQVGLPPIDDPTKQTPEIVEHNGQTWTTYQITGPEKEMVVTFVTVGESVWFFRLGGNAAAIQAQKKPYESFLRSIKFE